MITKEAFKPTAVLITPDAEWKDGNQIRVDPKRVTLLHLDSHDNFGWLFTREEWENDGDSRLYRRSDSYDGLRPDERIELLPDMWIVKIDEREYWVDETILDRTKRIFGVYVFDRRKHVHCCSFEATYELTFLGSQWEASRELTEEERDELDELIRDGDRDCQDAKYFGVNDVDRMLENEIKQGFLPTEYAGGYHVDVAAVVTDDAVAEIEELNCTMEV